jgi:CubicO group peptidase (beta-lactamase class C family)
LAPAKRRVNTGEAMDATHTHRGQPVERISAGTPPAGVTDAIRTMMRASNIPGSSLAVVNREGVLLSGGFGLADRVAHKPATASTAYLWFSMTKIVTATAALRLADEDRLDLSAPIDAYVDYLRAPGDTQPSVRQLLAHTAGLGNPLPLRWVHPMGVAAPDPETLLRRLMSRRRAYRYPVGQSARYSNVGYLAAGQIIATVAGMPFEAYVRQFVLQPLGMDGTGFGPPAGPDRAIGYVKAPRIADPPLRRVLPDGIAGDRHGGYLALKPFAVDGPAYGGLIGDVLDAGRFMRMHLCDGELDGNRILGPQTARRMRTIDQPGKPFDHGIGWFRRPPAAAGHGVEHFGAGAGFWNVMRLYPDRGLGIVVMSNSTATYDFEPLFALLAGASWS